MQVLQAPTPYVLPQKPRIARKRVSEFFTSVKKHEIREAVIKPSANEVVYIGKDDSLNRTNYVYTPELWKTLVEENVVFDVDTTSPSVMSDVFTTWFMIFIFFYLGRALLSNVRGPQNPFDITKSDFQIENGITTRFSDVQGIDTARGELEEIVDFLKYPEKYMDIGARVPTGALLTGKPGTGKTLLARAIAGESSVPFIQCSGSSFVEMFVGVGAKRVREIFEMARKNQPCIIFIDEIDAIGKKRSSGGYPSNDEREQTINQLLTEMDGFDDTSQIVVIAATNRVDILDEALLRPGRFDRKVYVSLPGVEGRRKILDVHSSNKKLDETVDLDDLARQTTGFSGADLANLMNECAIRGAREETKITPSIIESVYQRIVLGATSDVKLSATEKELVAYHEAGHAIMGALVSDFDTLRSVSIIPRGESGGVTFFQQSDEVLYTKEYFMSQIKVALGGRAAEEIVYGADKITTGASSDYARVYSIAREMVTTYGFGERYYDVNNMSPETARCVDIEIDRLVTKSYRVTKNAIESHLIQLDYIKDRLVKEEVVDGSLIYTIVKGYPPQ